METAITTQELRELLLGEYKGRPNDFYVYLKQRLEIDEQ